MNFFSLQRLSRFAFSLTIATTALLGTPAWAQESLTFTDDKGRTLTLTQPAKKIVSLVPHVTELLFEAGAGEQIIGAAEYSNYPEAAKSIPRVGDYYAINLETIVELKPDLIFAWPGGPTEQQLNRLQELGFNLFYSDPKSFADIQATLVKFGQLTGNEATAQVTAQNFQKRITELSSQYANTEKVTVFYQVWHDPIYTVSKQSFINEVLEVCGGDNVFKDLPLAAPQLGKEAVIDAQPQVLISQSNSTIGIDFWKEGAMLEAVNKGQAFAVSPDFIARPTPSLLQGTELICSGIAQIRAKI